jgi:PLP dependent protein
VISDALAAVRARLDSVGGAGVRIVAVTKGFGPDAVMQALDAGLVDIAENYAQEVLTKLPEVALPGRLDGVDVHFIGRLQRNKVRMLAPWITRWDSIDRAALVEEVSRRSPGARVLIQVDTSGDPGKGGAPLGEVPALVAQAQGLGLEVEGLMTVGPTGADPEVTRSGFTQVRALVDRLGLRVCSMGMSDDLELAVAAGSTEVRVGSALFGSRPRRSDPGAVA